MTVVVAEGSPATALRRSGHSPGVRAGVGRMHVTEIAPSPALRSFVRAYHYSDMDFGTDRLVKPLTARPELMLQFNLRRPMVAVERSSGRSWTAPDVVLVGRQTRRNLDLLVAGRVATLTVHFQPAGLYRLFHVPTRLMTDEGVDARDVLGEGVRRLHARVFDASCVSAMVRHVDEFLLARLDDRRAFHPVQAVAARMLDGGTADVGALAADCGLGFRQFERAFTEQIGLGPKLFSRIIRFTQVIQAKIDDPQQTWAGVSAAGGYYDQTHFIRDCRSFASDTPSALIRAWIDCRP